MTFGPLNQNLGHGVLDWHALYLAVSFRGFCVVTPASHPRKLKVDHLARAQEAVQTNAKQRSENWMARSQGFATKSDQCLDWYWKSLGGNFEAFPRLVTPPNTSEDSSHSKAPLKP